MFFIPLNQVESVELVIHALRTAGGEADCGSCPARKVCMKQCLSIAEAVGRMVAEGTLPSLDPPGPAEDQAPAAAQEKEPDEGSHQDGEASGRAGGASHLKVVK